MVTYFKQLIEMNVLSELSLRCKSVPSTTSFGNKRCQQNCRVIELPPHATSELSPMMDAVGILGIKCAIGVSNLIPDSGDKAEDRKFNSSRIVRLTR
jgi:hypothetical protein